MLIYKMKFVVQGVALILLLHISMISLAQREDLRREAFGATRFQKFDVKDFSHIHINSENAEVYLTNSCSYDLTINKHMLLNDNVQLKQKGDTLYISTPSDIGSLYRYDIYISLPTLSSINLEGRTQLYGMNKFHSKDLSLKTSGKSSVNLNISADDILVHSSDSSSIKLKGQAKDVNISAFDDSSVKANKLSSRSGTVNNKNSSKVSFNSKKTAYNNDNQLSINKNYFIQKDNQYEIDSAIALK